MITNLNQEDIDRLKKEIEILGGAPSKAPRTLNSMYGSLQSLLREEQTGGMGSIFIYCQLIKQNEFIYWQ